jgi:hypothetical protein
MGKGAFTDKQHLPTGQEIRAVLGKAGPDWKEFVQFVEKSFGVNGEWKYYGKNYGWALRFRKGGKALVSLYPGERSYTVQMILIQSVVDQTRTMKLGKAVRAAISKAHPYPEGRWVFLKIDSKSIAKDAKELLLLKSGYKSK